MAGALENERPAIIGLIVINVHWHRGQRPDRLSCQRIFTSVRESLVAWTDTLSARYICLRAAFPIEYESCVDRLMRLSSTSGDPAADCVGGSRKDEIEIGDYDNRKKAI